MAVGPSAPPMMAIPAAWLGSKPSGTEDAKLCRSTNQHQFRVGQKRREVGHRSDSQEDEWWIPALSYTLIEDVQHGVVLVETYLQACVSTEGDVAEDDAQSDGNKQQRLEVFLDGEPDEEGSHDYHDEVTYRHVGKARVGQELIEVFYDEICKSHNLAVALRATLYIG